MCMALAGIPSAAAVHVQIAEDVRQVEGRQSLAAVQRQLGLDAYPLMQPDKLAEAALSSPLAPGSASDPAVLVFDVLGAAGDDFRLASRWMPSWSSCNRAPTCLELMCLRPTPCLWPDLIAHTRVCVHPRSMCRSVCASPCPHKCVHVFCGEADALQQASLPMHPSWSCAPVAPMCQH